MIADTAASMRRRAVLMTDFVESTRHTETVGDAAMAAWWNDHDRMARDLLLSWQGIEVERTDGFVAVFDDEDQALACVEAYQEGLQRCRFPLLARAVVHAGPLTLVEAPSAHVAIGAKRYEADGLAKAVAARVLAIARGGQTLVTADVRFGGNANARLWRSHGHWLAKGIEEPFEVFELRRGDAWIAPPRDDVKCHRVARSGDVWLPTRMFAHSLPGERSGFVGRQRALGQVAAAIERGVRLLSLYGIGGLGKTRLAVRFGWLHLGDYPGGVWFCDLSQARSVDGICSAVAQGLGLPITGDEPLQQIGRAIAGRGRCLVILDNFEQVSEHAETTAGTWLALAPQATLIVTTRELTGIDGETAVPLAPMTAEDGAKLFLQRATAVEPTFRPTERDEEAIGQIVVGLDGLPLALELAAARTRLFSPAQLVERLHQRFEWLWSTRPRGGRQATLRAAFDWSWDLLGADERQALSRFSVFDGGFDLRAATSVLGDGREVSDAEALVETLLVKSLLVRTEGGRIRWLESVRQYASLQLRSRDDSSGRESRALLDAERAHWRHFAGFDEVAATAATADVGNFIVACQRATACGDLVSAPSALRAAWHVLRIIGPVRLGLDLATSVLALDRLPLRGKAIGHWVCGSAHQLLGDASRTREHFERGLDVARNGDDVDVCIRLLAGRALRHSADGDADAALDMLAEARDLARQLGDLRLESLALNAAGKVLDRNGKVDEAKARYEDALQLAQRARDARLEGGILGNLGGVRRDLGQLSEARSFFQQSIAIADEVGDRHWAGNGRCNLGLLCQESGDFEGARVHFTEAAAIASQIGHVALEYVVRCNLGILAAEEGRFEDARLSFEAAVRAAEATGDRRSEGQFRGYLGECLARQGHQTLAFEHLDRARQLLVEVDDRLSYGLLLCQRAVALGLAGAQAEAFGAAAEARDIAASLGTEPGSELGRSLARLVSR